MTPLIPFAAEPGGQQPPTSRVYSVKFLLGELHPSDKGETRAAPGRYTTAINVHNPNGQVVRFRKKAVLPAAGGTPTPPSRADFQVLSALEPDWALAIGAEEIRGELLGQDSRASSSRAGS